MPVVYFSNDRRFDPATGEVVVGTRVTRLEPQPATLLMVLATRPGELVSRDEICQRLWADGRHVDYRAGLHYAVREVRRALGDGGDIETLPRRGYRLRDGVVLPGPAVDRRPGRGYGLAPAVSSRRRAVATWALALSVTATVVALVERRPNDHHARMVALLQAVHDVLY